jgi:hypothetical protein
MVPWCSGGAKILEYSTAALHLKKEREEEEEVSVQKGGK